MVLLTKLFDDTLDLRLLDECRSALVSIYKNHEIFQIV